MALFPKASGGKGGKSIGNGSDAASAPAFTTGEPDADDLGSPRSPSGRARGSSQPPPFAKRAAGKKRGFTPAMRGLSGGHR